MIALKMRESLREFLPALDPLLDEGEGEVGVIGIEIRVEDLHVGTHILPAAGEGDLEGEADHLLLGLQQLLLLLLQLPHCELQLHAHVVAHPHHPVLAQHELLAQHHRALPALPPQEVLQRGYHEVRRGGDL
jgi:hypothetical protein